MNVAALLHDAPSDDHHRQRNDHHQQQQQQQQQQQHPAHSEHRYYPLPSPASLIGIDDSRYDHRRAERDRGVERSRDRLLPPLHHASYPPPLHFPPHQLIPPQSMLPPPPAHNQATHIYAFGHDERLKYPLGPPPERERRVERERHSGTPNYPVRPRTPPGYLPDQGRITPATLSRDPAHRRDPPIAPEPVMASLREREQRERDNRERDRDRDPDRLRDRDRESSPHMSAYHPPPFSPAHPLPPPPLSLAPSSHHAPRRRDTATPVETYPPERDQTAKEREHDRRVRESTLRENKDIKVKRDKERERDRERDRARAERERDREQRAHHVKHPSVEERLSSSTLSLHPSHAQIPQQQRHAPPPSPSKLGAAFIIPNSNVTSPSQPLAQTQPPSPSQAHITPTGPVQPPIPLPPNTNKQVPPSLSGPGHPPFHTPPPAHVQAPPLSQPPATTATPAARMPLPRTPTPPGPQPPFHLGTFIYPNLPFPYFFPPERDSFLTLNTLLGNEQGLRLVETTVIIPRTHLPAAPPPPITPLPVWGGKLEPQANLHKRVYTDDSDIVFAALHAGAVSWAEICAARGVRKKSGGGADLQVRLRMRREGVGEGGIYPGGLGEILPGVPPGKRKKGKERDREDIANNPVWSRSWIGRHDGSGFEVLEAKWIPTHTVDSQHYANRNARLSEYTERRLALRCTWDGVDRTAFGRKRRRMTAGVYNSNSMILEPIPEVEDIEPGMTIVWSKMGDRIGFKWNPNMVRNMIFPDEDEDKECVTIEEGPKRPPKKRRRLEPDNEEEKAYASGKCKEEMKDMIWENDRERFIVSRFNQEGEDKEGTGGMEIDGAIGGGGRKYRIRRLREEETGSIKEENAREKTPANTVAPKQTRSPSPPGESVTTPPASATSICPVMEDGSITVEPGNSVASLPEPANVGTSQSQPDASATSAPPAVLEDAIHSITSMPPLSSSEHTVAPVPEQIPSLSSASVLVSAPQPPALKQETVPLSASDSTNIQAPLNSPPSRLGTPPPSFPSDITVERDDDTAIIAREVDEGDLAFVPEGVIIGRTKVESCPAAGEERTFEGRKGWFLQVRRWKWA